MYNLQGKRLNEDPVWIESPTPQEVEGYERAVSEGLVKPVPDTPPALLPGRTAGQKANRVIFALIIGFFGLIISTLLFSTLPLYLPLGAFLAVTFFFYRAWGNVGEHNMRELQQGYTSLTLVWGTFQLFHGLSKRYPYYYRRRPWDYRGIWVLNNDGTVKDKPDYSILPPGLYPSPHKKDKWEVWTGIVWSDDYYPRPGTK